MEADKNKIMRVINGTILYIPHKSDCYVIWEYTDIDMYVIDSSNNIKLIEDKDVFRKIMAENKIVGIKVGELSDKNINENETEKS